MFGPQYGFLSGNGGTFIAAGITGTVQGFGAPPNAIGFLIESESSNSFNIRWTVGGVAANSTIGFLMEPGRSVDYVPCGTTVSICGATSTVGSVQLVALQWITGG